jgi:hypothetical protein
LMKTQLEVIRKHLDEHMYLQQIPNQDDAIVSFIEKYGWLMRELYCTKVCELRCNCEIASELSSSGDLLSKHLKQ